MHKKTHRHFVAVPVVLLALASMTLLHLRLPVKAEVFSGVSTIALSSHADAVPFDIGSSIRGVLQPESAVRASKKGDDIEVLKGEALIRCAGDVQVRAESVHIRTVSNAVSVLRDSLSVTVVPLLAPVLVQIGDKTMMIAPGQQLIVTSGVPSLTAVSGDWFGDRLAVARSLAFAETDTPNLFSDTLEEGTISASDVSGLLDASSTLDPSGGMTRAIIARLLTEGGRLSPEAAEVLMASDYADLALRQDMVAVLPAAARILRRPIADAVMETWTQAALRMALSETGSMLSLVHEYAELPRAMERSGFPKQARTWRESLLRVADVLRTELDAAHNALLDSDTAILEHGTEALEPVPAPIPQIPESERLPSDELVAMTRRALLDYGVLMGSATELMADTDRQAVDVSGILIAEGGNDVSYEFSYDPVRERVSDIVRDGRSLPNSVPAATFFGQ